MTTKKTPGAPAALDIRKGQVTEKRSREQFHKRFRARFYDPAFRSEDDAIDRLEEIAWRAYCESRKAPITAKAGSDAADPHYEVAVEWLSTRDAILRAQRDHDAASGPSRVLVVVAASRNDFTCPGEMSKSWRLAQLACTRLEALGVQIDVLDLSRLTSDPYLNIHPCKGCVSTAMPLCHWPCSCYPNHALGQVNDWMNEIYPRWVAAHGVIIVTPTYWYQATSPLKLMMDRLVCADGGNPDPSSTHGKSVMEAKQLELDGWDYPKHLSGRLFGLVVHGDVAGIEGVRRSLADWLRWMGMIEAGAKSQLDRYVGYYEPYATSHRALDGDTAFQREVENVAAAVAQAVILRRKGDLPSVGDELESPRAK